MGGPCRNGRGGARMTVRVDPVLPDPRGPTPKDGGPCHGGRGRAEVCRGNMNRGQSRSAWQWSKGSLSSVVEHRVVSLVCGMHGQRHPAPPAPHAVALQCEGMTIQHRSSAITLSAGGQAWTVRIAFRADIRAHGRVIWGGCKTHARGACVSHTICIVWTHYTQTMIQVMRRSN